MKILILTWCLFIISGCMHNNQYSENQTQYLTEWDKGINSCNSQTEINKKSCKELFIAQYNKKYGNEYGKNNN